MFSNIISNVRNFRISNQKVLGLLKKIFSIVVFVAHCAFLLQLLLGIFKVNGKTISIIESINLVLDFRPYWLSTLCNLAAATTYYIVVVMTVKNIVYSVRYLKSVLTSNDSGEDSAKPMLALSELFTRTFFYVIMLTVISQLILNHTPSVITVLFLIIGAIIYLATRMVAALVNQKDILISSHRTLIELFVLAALAMLMVIFSRIEIRSVVDGIVFFFSSLSNWGDMDNADIVYGVFSTLIKPLFYVILIFMTLGGTHVFLNYADEYVIEKQDVSTRLLWTCSIFAGIALVIFIFIGTVVDVNSFFALIADYLSIGACVAVLFMALRISNIPALAVEAPAEELPAEVEETAEEPATETYEAVESKDTEEAVVEAYAEPVAEETVAVTEDVAEETAVPNDVPETQEAPAPDAEKPRFCISCGAKLMDGAAFCHNCGAAVKNI